MIIRHPTKTDCVSQKSQHLNHVVLAGICFIFDLLSGRIDAPELLAQIPLHAPARQLREPEFLRMTTHRTNYGLFSPLDQMFRRFNSCAQLFEFDVSRDAFRNSVISYLTEN
jgi:hypothetical protein